MVGGRTGPQRGWAGRAIADRGPCTASAMPVRWAARPASASTRADAAGLRSDEDELAQHLEEDRTRVFVQSGHRPL